MARKAIDLKQRWYHDIFSILSICVICTLDMLYLCRVDFRNLGTDDLGQESPNVMAALLNFTWIYLIADMLWISLVPSCIPTSVRSVATHHVLCLVLLFGIPYRFPSFFCHFAVGMLVEFNTMSLLLRRNVSQGSILFAIFNMMFHTSWWILRILGMPLQTVFWTLEYIRFSRECGTFLNMVLVGPIGLTALTGLSIKWTFDMYWHKIRIQDSVTSYTETESTTAKKSL
jgi:hypothetical protein